MARAGMITMGMGDQCPFHPATRIDIKITSWAIEPLRADNQRFHHQSGRSKENESSSRKKRKFFIGWIKKRNLLFRMILKLQTFVL
jgi:hypothetical protein